MVIACPFRYDAHCTDKLGLLGEWIVALLVEDEREKEEGRERKRKGEKGRGRSSSVNRVCRLQIELQKVTILLRGERLHMYLVLGPVTHVLGPSFLLISPSYQVNGLCVFLGLVAAPRLTPEPLLR